MFEDFDSTKTVDGAAQKRLGASVMMSGALLTALCAMIVVFSARQVVQAAEAEVDVTFEEPPPAIEPEPEPEPETPPPEPEPQVEEARALMDREVLQAPVEIPDAAPEQSDADLAPVENSGPVDGFLTGVAGGRGGHAPSHSNDLAARDDEEDEAPQQMAQREDTSPAMQISGCRAPEMPAAARAQGIADQVIVRFKVNADGTVGDIQILRGDPIFHDAVRDCVASRTYEPARLGDGTAVASPKTQPFRFTLSNL